MEVTDEVIEKVKAKMQEIIDKDLPITKVMMTQEEAEELAEMILQETLNSEDCLVELENDTSIREMEVDGTFNGIYIDDAIVLN